MGGEGDKKPGETVDQTSKPVLDKTAVPDLIQHVFGLEVTGVKQLNGYDDLNFFVQASPTHSNPHIESVCVDGYTLKVLNSVESRRPEIVEAHNQLMKTLKTGDFNVPYPVPTLAGREWSLQRLRRTPGSAWRPVDESDPATEHVIRLLAFVPGQLLHSVPYTPTLMFESGEIAARVGHCLRDFHHPVYDSLESAWFMRAVPRVADFTWVVSDPARRAMAEQAVQRFCDTVIPQMDQLPQGMLHGDLNEQNLLVTPDAAGRPHVSGLIDFGDSHRSALLFELALIVMYLMIDCTTVDRLDVGGHVLAGYRRHRRLTPLEGSLLKTCVCARFAQSLVLGAHAYHQNPANEYVLVTAVNGWTAFKRIWDEPQDRLVARWDAIVQQYEQ